MSEQAQQDSAHVEANPAVESAHVEVSPAVESAQKEAETAKVSMKDKASKFGTKAKELAKQAYESAKEGVELVNDHVLNVAVMAISLGILAIVADFFGISLMVLALIAGGIALAGKLISKYHSPVTQAVKNFFKKEETDKVIPVPSAA